MDDSSRDHSPSIGQTSSSSSNTTSTQEAPNIGSVLVAANGIGKGTLIKPINKLSDCWNHFHSYSNDATNANCNLCGQDVSLGKSLSTSKLTQHLRARHRSVLVDEEIQKNKQQLSSSSSEMDHHDEMTAKKSKITGYFGLAPVAPIFLNCYLKWTIKTYQPLNTCEGKEFREMMQSANPKCGSISNKVVLQLVLEKEGEFIAVLSEILKDQYFALTDDGWTSRRLKSYTAVTAHWIDAKWKLNSCTLGCKPKEGRATAVDHVDAVESMMEKFSLSYKKLVANVTDTEATMIAAGRLLVENSAANGGKACWGPCVDHILECTTGVAMSDTPNSSGTMASCRKLAGHFHSSSQANDTLLNLQNTGGGLQANQRAVTTIQDVVTRWWSTYSMCSRLLRLKKYFEMMVVQGTLPADQNLTADQWNIVAQISKLLEPFMEAQKVLEGEKYVTISMVPTIIMALRAGLISIIDNQNNAEHIRTVAAMMFDDFNERWGHGEEGTIFIEHTTPGPRRRPKGIPLMTILASALDPRFKALLDFNDGDRIQILADLRTKLVEVALETDEIEQHVRGNAAAVGAADLLQAAAPPAVVGDAVYAAVPNVLNEHARKIAEYNARRVRNVPIQNDLAAAAAVNNARIAAEHQVDIEMKAFDLEQMLEMSKPRIGEEGKYEYNNPLDWWSKKEKKYPIHAKLARRYLCIPATSAPSERVFSAAGLTIAKDRASLNPETADALIFLHESWDVVESYLKTR